jgi:hypothetical protein
LKLNSNLTNKTYAASDFSAQQAVLNTEYCHAVKSGNIAFVQLRFTTNATIDNALRILQFPGALLPVKRLYGLCIVTWGSEVTQIELDPDGRIFKAGTIKVSTDYMLTLSYICK